MSNANLPGRFSIRLVDWRLNATACKRILRGKCHAENLGLLRFSVVRLVSASPLPGIQSDLISEGIPH
jgi:hypothetical protein